MASSRATIYFERDRRQRELQLDIDNFAKSMTPEERTLFDRVMLEEDAPARLALAKEKMERTQRRCERVRELQASERMITIFERVAEEARGLYEEVVALCQSVA